MTWSLAFAILDKYGPEAVLLAEKYGPQAVAFAVKIRDNIKAGQGATTVPDGTFAAIVALGAETTDGIYTQLGITPPPPSP